jgi:hypothetical protein
MYMQSETVVRYRWWYVANKCMVLLSGCTMSQKHTVSLIAEVKKRIANKITFMREHSGKSIVCI